eukprot:4017779-Amphidinium_carterae.1
MAIKRNLWNLYYFGAAKLRIMPKSARVSAKAASISFLVTDHLDDVQYGQRGCCLSKNLRLIF